MGRLIDLTSKVFGEWLVISKSDRKAYQPLWLCRCICGVEKEVSGANLRTGISTGCGCTRQHIVKHGHARRGSKSKTYRTWKNMHFRCTPNSPDHANYHDRGIYVCKRWYSYELFLADMGESPENLSIDRIENNGPYEPGNCRWATARMQRRNSRRLTIVKLRGQEHLVKDASALIGVSETAIYQEAKRSGLGIQDAFDRVLMRRAA